MRVGITELDMLFDPFSNIIRERTYDVHHWNKSLVFYVDKGSLFCPITKVASTYWYNYLVKDRTDVK